MRCTLALQILRPTLTGRSLADESFYEGAMGNLNLESPQIIRRKKKKEEKNQAEKLVN